MFLAREREILAKYAPKLDEDLARLGLEYLETPEPGRLADLMKKHRLPGLLVAPELGGMGCSPNDAIRVQRAVAARSPSMGVMMTMHNFTISFCNLMADLTPAVPVMLEAVGRQQKLVASGFAEGRYGAGILDSTLLVRRDGDGYRLSGSKKPCSMTHCMDILTAGIAHAGPDGIKRTGMAIVFADQEGISRHPFWNAPVLRAADSHELRLENVFVPAERVVISDSDNEDMKLLIAMGEVCGLCWFEVMITATYLGVVSGLAERVIGNPKIDAAERVALGSELETAQAALDGAVRMMEIGPLDESLLAQVLLVRFSIQRAIERCAMRAAELVGGLAFIRDAQIATYLSSARCLAFHPISRKAAEPMLAGHLSGTAAAQATAAPAAAVAA
jgi:alkylation response protein AidB-like acyl-CoA dehydrogenase